MRLQPFSLGHLILLHRVESAFVIGDQVSYEDLAISVFICSRTYREAIQQFSDPDLDKFMYRWAKKLEQTPTWRHKLGRLVPWRWHRKSPFKWLKLRVPEPIDLQGKAAEFIDYMVAGSKSPYYSYDPAKSKGITAASAQVIRAGLLSETGMTDEQIMNQPYGLTLHDWITIKAQQGHVNLTSREGIAKAQQIGERLAKLSAEGKLGNA